MNQSEHIRCWQMDRAWGYLPTMSQSEGIYTTNTTLVWCGSDNLTLQLCESFFLISSMIWYGYKLCWSGLLWILNIYSRNNYVSNSFGTETLFYLVKIPKWIVMKIKIYYFDFIKYMFSLWYLIYLECTLIVWFNPLITFSNKNPSFFPIKHLYESTTISILLFFRLKFDL